MGVFLVREFLRGCRSYLRKLCVSPVSDWSDWYSMRSIGRQYAVRDWLRQKTQDSQLPARCHPYRSCLGSVDLTSPGAHRGHSGLGPRLAKCQCSIGTPACADVTGTRPSCAVGAIEYCP